MAEVIGTSVGTISVSTNKLEDIANSLGESNRELAENLLETTAAADELLSNWSGETRDEYMVAEMAFRNKTAHRIQMMESSKDQLIQYSKDAANVNTKAKEVIK